MNLRNKKRRAAKAKAAEALASFAQQEKRAGLLVTKELEKALAECKALVERIAKDCRAQNRRFRWGAALLVDVEFDLENDRELCLFGLSANDRNFRPSGVERVTKIFPEPSFFVDGVDSNDIVQGPLGDCYFLSALSTMTTSDGLIEKFCVARDEKVGVYGYLYTSIPKFEELTPAEQSLYHRDKNFYNSSARKGTKSLYFSRSSTENETWVPLIEKAYAKLHGDYASISGGFSCEAIEDLTGGVSTFIPTKDILDPDVFWKEELLLATKDRLFGCGFDALDGTRSGNEDITVNGLIGGHAYSVLRAVEYKGKRFVVLRNPWGDSEWTGPWSDGSKEWTEEWLPALKELRHQFGDDGEFVMEYYDFLDNWDLVERTLLFDDTWIMSSQWLQVTARPPTAAWSYGDVSFTITIPAPTKAVIVLSKLDERYFSDISGNSCWTFDFALFKKGSKELVAQSRLSRFYLRSVNLEAQLDAGEYVVHVRLDREINDQVQVFHPGNCDTRKFSRVQTERAKSQSIASNFKARFDFLPFDVHLHTKTNNSNSAALATVPIPLDVLAGQDLTELETKAVEAEKQLRAAEAALKKPPAGAEGKTASEEKEPAAKEEEITIAVVSETTAVKRNNARDAKPKAPIGVSPGHDGEEVNGNESDSSTDDEGGEDSEVDLDNIPASLADEDLGLRSGAGSPAPVMDDARSESSSSDSEYRPEGSASGSQMGSGYDNDTVVLGLRVYTSKDAPAVVGGQLRHEMKTSLAALANSAL
ncbi:Calpain catalytic domain-containing protein [Mycena venus]|uniref:Calpain catalytic domain-containing protein n=1 Tax=Mycena venus TaxID=2733690 RepID=A0A8H6XPI8_9AGAR|nr:Calpain catalytic domain-containing protein [Mycena venus]